MSMTIDTFAAAWADAFTAADAEGTAVDLFAAIAGAPAVAMADDRCRSVLCDATGATPRWVARWTAFVPYCEACAAKYA